MAAIKEVSMGDKIVGKIVFVNEARGFSFIRRVQSDVFEKYFLHVSDIMSGTPRVDAAVRFHVRETPKGPSAVNAEVLDDVAVNGFDLSIVLGGGR